MSNEKIEAALQRIDGQPCLYNGKTVKITGYEINGEKVLIHSEHKTYTLPKFSFHADIKAFQVIDDGLVLHQPVKPTIVSSDVMQGLAGTLLDNIKRVQENAEFIPQAKQINSDVKTLVEMAKAEIEFLKLNKGL